MPVATPTVCARPSRTQPFTSCQSLSRAGHCFVQDAEGHDLHSADLAVPRSGHGISRARHAGGRGTIGMEFLVILLGFVALFMALNARKRAMFLQLEQTGLLTRLSRLEDGLEELRRQRPQAPASDVAAPADRVPE